MRRAKLSVLAVVFSLGLLIVSGASVGGTHYFYRQQDSGLRAQATPLANWVAAWWAYGYSTPWWDDRSFYSEVLQATQSWQNAVTQLTFTRSPSWALYFAEGPCPSGLACIVFDVFLPDPVRGASYWSNAEIHLAAPQSWTPLGRGDALRHEIGHWVGLHEQYIEASGQCSSVQSVMNTGSLTTGENCLFIHAPTAWDITQATRYWSGDGLQSAVLSLVQSERPFLRLEWKDAMWAEYWQEDYIFYWDWGTSSWVQLDIALYNDAIGLHREAVDLTMVAQWDYQARGWPVNTWYIAGASAWSYPFPGWTGSVWSNQVQVLQ